MPSDVDAGYADANDRNWLVRLRSYRASPNRVPAEDYLSTTLAWALASHGDVRQRVLRELFPDIAFPPDVASPNKCRIQTQQINAVGDRPDIRIECKDFVGLVECKVGAPPDIGQLERYLERLSAEAFGRKSQLTYLGSRLPVLPEELKKRVNLCRWHSIYRAVQEVEASHDARVPLVAALLGLMEDMKLTPTQSVRPDFGATITLFAEQKKSLEQLLKLACERFELRWQATCGERPNPGVGDPANGILPKYRYIGQKYYLTGDETAFGIYLSWYDDNQLSLALYLQQPKSESTWEIYKTALSRRWIERWKVDWPGATLRIPVTEVQSDFFTKDADEQAELLESRVETELRAVLRQR